MCVCVNVTFGYSLFSGFVSTRRQLSPHSQFGSVLVAAAPFIFVLVASPSFAISCAFVVLLSLGEALISPRLNEYAASIAPLGREGTYLALGHSPNFLGKVFSGFSGELLNAYCPCHQSACEPYARTLTPSIAVSLFSIFTHSQ